MTDELADYDEQLEDLIHKVRSALQSDLPKLTGQAKLEKIQYLKGRVERIRQVFSSFKTELRELTKHEARPFEEKGREYERIIAELQADMDRAKEQAELTDSITGGKTVEQMSTRDIINVASQVQAQSKAATDRSKLIVEETIEIGTETSKTLKAQTEQLNRIDKQVEIVDNNLDLARKQLRVFIRRMATDKLVMTLICLVILGIIAAIVAAAIKGKQGGSNPTPTPTIIPLAP